MNNDLDRIYNIPKLSAKQIKQVKLGLNERDIDAVVEELSHEWSDIYFDDVAEQIAIMAEKYIEERVKYHE